MTVSTVIIAVAALLALALAVYLYVSYPLWLSDMEQHKLVDSWDYPAKRERLRRIALSDSYGYWAQNRATEKLPYPEERETLRRIALNSGHASKAAAKKLPYPEERETLIEAALRGDSAAAKKLPYPEERETLMNIALGNYGAKNAPWEIRRMAIGKFPHSEESVWSKWRDFCKNGHSWAGGVCRRCGKVCQHDWETVGEENGEEAVWEYNSYGLPPYESGVDEYTITIYECKICGKREYSKSYGTYTPYS